MSESRWAVTSPDERLVFELQATITAEESLLAYRILHEGEETVMHSRLGFGHTAAQFVDLIVTDVTDTAEIEQTYRLVHGKQRHISAAARERIVTFRNPAGAEGQLIARAFNDGVAFRYRTESHERPRPRLTGESTEFRLDRGRAWIQPHDAAAEFTPAYEALYTDGIPIGTPEPGPSWNMPALFRTRDRWVLIAESDFVPPTLGMHLSSKDTEAYRVVPPEADEGRGVGDLWPVVDGTWESPWRVVIIGKGLDTIVETTLITDLATPS